MTFSVDVQFQLLIDNSWVDFTRIDSVTKMLGDGKNAYTVIYGQANESGNIPPMSVTLKYQDNNGVLNEDNPLSPYAGKIAQYTKAKILNDGFEDILGELASIDIDDNTGNIVTLTITIASVDRRLSQGQKAKPLRSPAYRALVAPENDSTRILYYPLEEEKNATELKTPFPTMGTSINYSGALTFGGYTAHPASEKMISFGTAGQISFNVPLYSSTQHKVCAVFKFPDTLPTNTVLYRMYCTGGNAAYIDLQYGATFNGTLKLLAYDRSGALIDDANFIDWSGQLPGHDCFIAVQFAQNGANLDNDVLVVDQNLANNGLVNSDSLIGVTIGRIYRVTVGYTDCNGLSVGHFIIGNDIGAFPNFISPTFGGGLGTRGFTGEPVGWRIYRLLTEENLNFIYYGDFDDTLPMGPQRVASLFELLRDAQAVDGGLLYCDRVANGTESLVTYRNVRDMYNRAPVAIVDVTASAATSQLTGSMRPRRDDQGRKNDVTVTRNGGASGRFFIPDGDNQHYSTQDPPAGMGPVEASATYQLYLDKHARLRAAWDAHLGAWRGPRYPAITIDAWRAAVQNDSALLTGLDNLILGDNVQVNTTSSVSRWVPHNDFGLKIRGYSYTTAQTTKSTKYNCAPAEPWEIDMTDTTTSTLAKAISNSDTNLLVDMASGPPWRSLTGLETNYYAQIAGDVMQVSLMQLLSPSFVSTGAVSHGNNANVTPGAPAGAANGDALILMAAIRNSGAGTVDLPAGWTDISNFGNFRIMGRYRAGSAADTPTVTFTGGVANADTSAVIMCFRNTSIRATTAVTLLNGSAQNIVYPRMRIYPFGSHRYTACVACIAAWKQDDTTGVAPAAGFTEAVDAATTTGNDQAFTFDYRLDTTLTEVAAGSLVVTGGAAAISRAIVFGLRPLQQATVTRNINNSATSHAIGDQFKGWRTGVTGL